VGNNAELKLLRKANTEVTQLESQYQDEITRLRTELANASELLREAIPHAWGNGAHDWVERVNAFLELAGDCKP
jgi:hypothetical protein